MAWLQNGIDKSRDGYVRLVTPIARRGFIALLLVGGFVRGDRRHRQPGADAASCPTRTRAPSWPSCSCPTPPRPTARWPRVEEVEKTIAGRPWLQSMFTVSGYSLIDGLAPAQPRAGRGRAETLCRAQGRQACRCSTALQGTQHRLQPDRLGQRLRLQPAADHGAGQFVGLRVRGPVAGRRLAGRPRGRVPRPDDLGAAGAAARRRLHDLRRLDAADQPQARPRARPGAGRVDLATSSRRCRRRWAAPTPTTSTCSAAPGR